MFSAEHLSPGRSRIRCLLAVSNRDLEREALKIIANDPDCIICGRVREIGNTSILARILKPELILSDYKLEQIKRAGDSRIVLLKLRKGGDGGATVKYFEGIVDQKFLGQWLSDYKKTIHEGIVDILVKNQPGLLALKVDDSMTVFSVDELRMVHAVGKRTQAVFANRTITMNIRLGIFLKWVKADFLVRVDRSTAINVHHIHCLTKKRSAAGAVLSMIDGSEFSLGRKAYYRLLTLIR